MSDTDWSEGWHYSSATGHQGPVSAVALVQLHLKKSVRPEDQVWHPALPDWCTLREAWPHLRPFKDGVVGRSSGGGRARREYRVVEIIGGLTPDQVQQALNSAAAEGFVYDNAIVVDPSRCLLVMRK